MTRHLKNQNGFTLLEVLLVLTIVAVLTMIAQPSISSFRSKSQLKSSAIELVGDFNRARSEAIKRRSNCALTFEQPVAGTTYDYVVYLDADKDSNLDGGEEILKMVNLSANGGADIDESSNSFADNAAGRPSVAYTSRGVLKDNAQGSVVLFNPQGESLSVSAVFSGRVKID